MQLLHNTPGLTVQHDTAHGWLIVSWLGAHPGRSARAGCEAILTCVRATGCTKILNDGSQDEDGWQELACWVAQTFLPQLAAEGVVAVAWVAPNNLRAHMTMNEVLAATTSPQVTAFMEIEDAYAWLCKAAKTPVQGGSPQGFS